jgi:hypothetical protein
MQVSKIRLITAYALAGLFLTQLVYSGPKEIVRPERIKSKRQVVYDQETYAKLATLWKEYYNEFPSEDAYANWMYAARYAGDEAYEEQLEKGLKKYPANPALLYLKAMTRCGTHDNVEGQRYLERATELDPDYMDSWFGLVTIYMDQKDEERLNLALRNLLEGGAIAEEVMDYSYNMLLGLGRNAILITNGDNDTFPGWVLTRILNHRPDVSIVNRSLLNTDWYPMYIIEHGLPNFITKGKLDELRENILNDIRERKASVPSVGPFSDTLIVRIIESADKVGRPVYFAWTLYDTPTIKRYMDAGRPLALVTLVTTPTQSYAEDLNDAVRLWLHDFRTGGLDSWRLHHAKAADAGRMLMSNYASGIHMLLESISKYTPKYRLDLFHWYVKHLSGLLSQEIVGEMNEMWCRMKDIDQIQQWCRRQGYLE